MTDTNIDLTQCDKEPIHIPSAIQPHGFFIAIDPKSENIIAASSSIEDYFTFSAQTIVNEPLATMFPVLSAWIHSWKDAFSVVPRVFTLSNTRDNSRFIVTMHKNETTLILEGEPAQHADLFPEHIAQAVINEATKLSGAKSVEDLCHLGVISLQRLSGFGRVMLYQFDDEYNGCVISESKISSMESYLDHHFPAGDIPVQARELYRLNLIRFIHTSTYEPSILYTTAEQPIDMTYSTLRSVSPIHLEYLRNMGVGASMSLSIIVKGKLWGLIACHHPISISLAATIQRFCTMFIRIFNALLEEKIASEESQTFFQYKNRHTALKEAFMVLNQQSDLHDTFHKLGKLWLDALDGDGVCLLQNNQITTYAAVPDEEEILEIARLSDPLHQNDMFASSSLTHDFPDLLINGPIAGFFSLIISHDPYIKIIWFRNEWIRDLKWAGNPTKPVNIDSTQRISPRLSFETILIQQKGKSTAWSKAHFMVAELYKEFGSLIELDTAHQTMINQQKLLIQQGKMAMMGEMMGAIAHQWNQPLNSLSLLISGLSELIEDSDDLSLDDIKKMGMNKIHFMSETLHAFRNFFKPDRAMSDFSIKQTILDVAHQLLPKIGLHKIQLIINDNPGIIHGYPNEFKQVVLNLLANASEILIENHVSEPWIKCVIDDTLSDTTLSICDNGGGILPHILDKIFQQFASSKEEQNGTGIGLYLSKLIIVEHFKGTITAHNTLEGACFTLILPKNNG